MQIRTGVFRIMRHKFGFRTILIPVACVAGFLAIQSIVMVIYILIPTFIAIAAGSLNPEDIEAITKYSTDLIMKNSNIVSMIYSVLIAGIAILVILALRKKNREAVMTRKITAGQGIASAFSIIGAAGLTTLLFAGITLLAKYVPSVNDALNYYYKLSESFISSDNIYLIILSTCILVPIAEDLVFRGIIQGELRRVMPAWLAIVIQALIFALVHGNVVQTTYVMVPALVLGAVYEWTGSIYVPIGMHMIFNFVGSAVPMMLQENETATTYFVLAEYAMIPVAVLCLIYLYLRRQRDLQEETAVFAMTGQANDTIQINDGDRFNDGIQANDGLQTGDDNKNCDNGQVTEPGSNSDSAKSTEFQWKHKDSL